MLQGAFRNTDEDIFANMGSDVEWAHQKWSFADFRDSMGCDSVLKDCVKSFHLSAHPAHPFAAIERRNDVLLCTGTADPRGLWSCLIKARDTLSDQICLHGETVSKLIRQPMKT